MASPGFPSGQVKLNPNQTSMDYGTTGPDLSGLSGGGSANPSGLDMAGSAGIMGGIYQMIIGQNQLNKARRLPLPSFRSAMGPYAGMKSLYEQGYKSGLPSEVSGQLRSNLTTRLAQFENKARLVSPQSSAVVGRIASMDRVSGEANIMQQNLGYKEGMLSGLDRMNLAMSNIIQKDISAQRSYRIMAEQAAGAAIKTGTENIMAGTTPEEKQA